MQMTVREDVQVWCEHERPVRLVVGGERWRIIDVPTRSDGGRLFQSWRFTARSDVDHRTRVMDVEEVEGHWSLVAAWD
ncbi:hypothetical protein [Microbacterium hibisci]|uniref:hypothetical protein n=1 Tax=Microbacterium hibisci TaxID=2036000 RepID=UPI0019447999|nr:hypothetical protein [Microbacterium hibisci]